MGRERRATLPAELRLEATQQPAAVVLIFDPLRQVRVPRRLSGRCQPRERHPVELPPRAAGQKRRARARAG